MFVKTFMLKTGLCKYNSGGPGFSTILSYFILPSSFTEICFF